MTSPISDKIEFFFDLASPYAYLAFHKIGEVAARHCRSVRYRAIDLAVVKKAAGNTGPSNRDIPPKFAYLKHDFARWAELYDVPFAFPDPSNAPPDPRNSELSQRGVLFAERYGKAHDYISAIWLQTWGGGKFIGDPVVVETAVREAGLPEQAFFAFVSSEEAAAGYQATTEEARQRGVFGVPIMICDGQMWWGNDRIDLLDRYLAAQGNPAADPSPPVP